MVITIHGVCLLDRARDVFLPFGERSMPILNISDSQSDKRRKREPEEVKQSLSGPPMKRDGTISYFLLRGSFGGSSTKAR